jgi:hypothetical protein
MIFKKRQLFLSFIVFSLSVSLAHAMENPEEKVRLHAVTDDGTTLEPLKAVPLKETDNTGRCAKFFSKKLPMCMLVLTKGALDLAALMTVLQQLPAITDFRGALDKSLCNPGQAVCISNTASLLSNGREAYWVDIGQLCLSSLALVTDIASGCLYICSSENNALKNDKAFVSQAVSLLFSGAALFCVIGANANLWSGAIQCTDDISSPVIDSLNQAMLKGIGALVSNFIVGCPGAALLCFIAVTASNN